VTCERIRLRFVAPLRVKTPPFALTGTIAFLPMDAIGDDGSYDRTSVRDAEEIADAGYTYFEQGDVVRARVTPCFENGKGAFLSNLTGGRGLGTTELFVFKPSRHIDPQFLYYVTVSEAFTEQGTATLYGAHGVRRVDDQFVRNYRVWVPSIETQRAIANYLVGETARIDDLILAKRRMAELLREQLSVARIDLVVDRREKERQEGPAWLGSIPSQWKLKRLKFVAEMESGHTPNRQIEAYWIDCTVPWITLNDVSELEADWRFFQPKNAVNELGLRNSSAHVLPEDAVVLSRDATVGRSALLGRPMAVSQHFVAWVCGPELVPEYLLQVLRGPMQHHFGSLTAGATIATIGMPDLKQLAVPVPPLREQVRIVRQIAVAEDLANEALARVDQQMRLLQERRRALITAAVNGELGVPAAV
jgi:type I restriction enzyme S subunit